MTNKAYLQPLLKNPTSGWLSRFPFLQEEQVRPPLTTALALSLFLLLALPLPTIQFFPSPAEYLPVHTLLELLSIAVSMMVFALVGSLIGQGTSSRLILLGTGFLAVCLIDLGHIFSYPGMPDFVTPSSTGKAIVFWLGARYLLSFVLLFICLLPDRRWSKPVSAAVLLLGLVLASGVWWLGLYQPPWLPTFFVEGQGLTQPKIIAEYLLTVLYGATTLLLGFSAYRTRNRQNIWLAAATWILALSELYFTLYTNVTDLFNLMGHMYKVIAYFMVYRAIFVAAVETPYRELEHERSWAQSLLASLPEPVWLKDPHGRYMSCNKAFKELCGLEPEAVVGQTDYDIFTSDNADLFREYDLVALASDQVSVNEEWVETWGKDRRLFKTSKIAVRLPNGALLGVLGLTHDITNQRATADDLQQLATELEQEVTERRQVEKQLLAANFMYDAVIRDTPIPLVVVDPAGIITTWNDAAERTFGFTKDEMVGSSGRRIFAEGSAPVFDAACRHPQTSTIKRGAEVLCRGKAGKNIHALLYISPVRSEGGHVRAIIFAIEDMTERRSMEAQLRQSQKLEAVGQLTAGIAHDFNNILAVVLGNIELLLEKITDSKMRSIAQNAFDAGMRGASLNHRLLAYSRKQSLEPSIVDVGQLLVNDAKLLERSLKESISISLEIEGGLWRVRVDASRLQDAILNLAINSRDAMRNGGRLTIEARNAMLDEEFAVQHAELVPGRYVCLRVRDTGTGIPAELLEQVLEPFFTTKPVGEGSGLGLSMVYGFVRQTGGHFEISSTVGVGTCISLYLPAVPEDPARQNADAATEACPPARPGESILVVEDNPEVRTIVLLYLNSLGYAIVDTVDGPSALDILRSGCKVDLILTDVVLPNGMSGPDIVKAAQEILPDLKALYMSGYAKDTLSQDGELRHGIHLLSKPFRKSTLARKLRELLDG